MEYLALIVLMIVCFAVAVRVIDASMHVLGTHIREMAKRDKPKEKDDTK